MIQFTTFRKSTRSFRWAAGNPRARLRASRNGACRRSGARSRSSRQRHFVPVQPKSINDLQVPIVHLAVPNAAVLPQFDLNLCANRQQAKSR